MRFSSRSYVPCWRCLKKIKSASSEGIGWLTFQTWMEIWTGGPTDACGCLRRQKIADVNKECMVPDHAPGKNPQGKNVALRSERQTPEGKPKTRIWELKKTWAAAESVLVWARRKRWKRKFRHKCLDMIQDIQDTEYRSGSQNHLSCISPALEPRHPYLQRHWPQC